VLLTEPGPLMFHAEIVRRDGREVGYIRAASYGWTLGGAIGLAMIDSGRDPIDQAWLDAGHWTVQIGDNIVPARVSLRPLYDPAGKRIRM
jgi:4-methylaminobutanoate oxidase (formaldehyde-forming)